MGLGGEEEEGVREEEEGEREEEEENGEEGERDEEQTWELLSKAMKP